MENKKYNPQLKTFLGTEVRTVTTEDNKTYIILKDMFNALGRVKADGTWTDEKEKMVDFLTLMDKVCDLESFVVTSKTVKNKSIEFLEDIDKEVDYQSLEVDSQLLGVYFSKKK